MVNLSSLLRDPQHRYFDDYEYEKDPDQLPLAKVMRRFGFVIFILGVIELIIGLLVFSFFENFQSQGFIGAPVVILAGAIAMCIFSSTILVVINVLISAAAILIALFLWSWTIADYSKIDSITVCHEIEYVPPPTSNTTTLTKIESCMQKYADFECLCTDNMESFCYPYTINGNGDCDSILEIYQYELGASIVFLTFSMFVLVLYIFVCYVSLVVLGDYVIVIPEWIKNIPQNVYILRYYCIKRPPDTANDIPPESPDNNFRKYRQPGTSDDENDDMLHRTGRDLSRIVENSHEMSEKTSEQKQNNENNSVINDSQVYSQLADKSIDTENTQNTPVVANKSSKIATFFSLMSGKHSKVAPDNGTNVDITTEHAPMKPKPKLSYKEQRDLEANRKPDPSVEVLLRAADDIFTAEKFELYNKIEHPDRITVPPPILNTTTTNNNSNSNSSANKPQFISLSSNNPTNNDIKNDTKNDDYLVKINTFMDQLETLSVDNNSVLWDEAEVLHHRQIAREILDHRPDHTSHNNNGNSDTNKNNNNDKKIGNFDSNSDSNVSAYKTPEKAYKHPPLTVNNVNFINSGVNLHNLSFTRRGSGHNNIHNNNNSNNISNNNVGTSPTVSVNKNYTHIEEDLYSIVSSVSSDRSASQSGSPTNLNLMNLKVPNQPHLTTDQPQTTTESPITTTQKPIPNTNNMSFIRKNIKPDINNLISPPRILTTDKNSPQNIANSMQNITQNNQNSGVNNEVQPIEPQYVRKDKPAPHKKPVYRPAVIKNDILVANSDGYIQNQQVKNQTYLYQKF